MSTNSLLNNTQPHIPVMLETVMDNLLFDFEAKILDCTFGAGGYSKAILNKGFKLTALDQDPIAKQYSESLSAQYKDKFHFLNGNFSDIGAQLAQNNESFDAIIMDLGVSTMQLNMSHRGFSFNEDGPLDMRMGNHGITAQEVINNLPEEEIANIIFKYGDEGYSRKIARKIVIEREIEPIVNTLRLAEIVRKAIGRTRYKKIDSATKTFQAIRIYVNDELNSLTRFLNHSRQLLNISGLIITISFHALEDKIVKSFFINNAQKRIARSKYAKNTEEEQNDKWMKVITKKPLIPSAKEILTNPSSRSAKMRIAMKII
ncbi:MAG: 16S rRNA (cytosine(1402)-N(4))-methyltransferase RsmH [Rickettsiaceae bacterium]